MKARHPDEYARHGVKGWRWPQRATVRIWLQGAMRSAERNPYGISTLKRWKELLLFHRQGPRNDERHFRKHGRRDVRAVGRVGDSAAAAWRPGWGAKCAERFSGSTRGIPRSIGRRGRGVAVKCVLPKLQRAVEAWNRSRTRCRYTRGSTGCLSASMVALGAHPTQAHQRARRRHRPTNPRSGCSPRGAPCST